MKLAIHIIVLVVMLGRVCSVCAGWKDDIGFTSLQARLGGDTPTGAGIDVTQVENEETQGQNNYLPNTNHADFAGKTINAESGSGGVSSHATTVGRYYYGLTTSTAPEIDPIDSYEVNHWIIYGLLMVDTPFSPWTETRRVQNHSWVGTTEDDEIAIDILRRIDLVAERDGVAVAAGVNNGSGSQVPHLLSSAYNILAVGLTNGNSSYGPTTIDVSGRVKPDIVVPTSKTSWAAPIVASAAAILLETADADGVLAYLNPQDQKIAKALLAKALLMAGATKDEFVDWRKGFDTPSTDGIVPLDYRYGAGEQNIDNSHLILTAGEQNASVSSDVDTTGWDFESVTAGGSKLYFFELPAYSYATELSILVAWNRHIDVGSGDPLTLTPSMANIDLRLYEADGYTIGALLDESISSIDNVEHIFLHGLTSGRYVLELTSDMTWDYAVAWAIQVAPTPPYDFDGDGDVDYGDFECFQCCATGPSIPYAPDDLPPCCPFTPDEQGIIPVDFDRDGDVDQSDFGPFQRCISGPDMPVDLNCAD